MIKLELTKMVNMVTSTPEKPQHVSTVIVGVYSRSTHIYISFFFLVVFVLFTTWNT